MEIALFKMLAILPIGFGMSYITKKIKEAQGNLFSQKMSWQEYETLKQASIGAVAFMLLAGCVICAL